MADRTLVLTAGRVTAEGPTADVLEHLDVRPLAERFGAATVVEARVVRHDSDYQLTWLELAGQSLSVPGLGHLAEGEVARLVVRARDVSLATERPRSLSMRNVLAGRVVEVREEAGSTFADVAIDLGPYRLLSRVTRLSLHELELTVGSPVFALLKSVSLSR